MADIRLGIMVINGWRITAVTQTRFEAHKDGETVQLDADTLPDILATASLNLPQFASSRLNRSS